MAIESNSNREGNEERQKRDGARFASLFVVAMGSGVPLGLALHNLPLGIAIGTFFGLAVAIALRVARIRGETHDAGESGKMGLILAVAAVGGLVVLVGGIILYEMLLR